MYHTHERLNMNAASFVTLEKIKTTKGCYSMTMEIREDHSGIIRIDDTHSCTAMRLDIEDLRRIRLLIDDHIPRNDDDAV